MLIYRLLRQDELCKGEEKQARGCSLAQTVRCTSCKCRWTVEDSDFPGDCPNCGDRAAVTERCDSCPVAGIEHARAISAAGRLLERVLDLDFDTQRFRIGWDDVTCEEASALKILVQERNKWEREDADKKREEAELDIRMRAMQNGRR